MNPSEGKALFEKIKKSDEQAFEVLFTAFYKSLCLYAKQFLNEDEAAEEVAQDIFVKLWEKRNSLEIEISVKNYLFRSVKNQCLNVLQHNKIKKQYSEKVLESSKQDPDPSQYFLEIELAQKIELTIDSLPDKRKEIFRMSREEGMKYKEIADKLNISIKTVEAQMGLALKYLREKLKKYNPNLLLIHIFSKLN